MPVKNRFPKHIAIIMDGNGRWAKERSLPRNYGHREGVKRVKEVIQAAAKVKVGFVTFFAFSTENWNRPKKEINMLMRYLDNFLTREINNLHKNNICFKMIGDIKRLPENIQKKIINAQDKTLGNTGLTVVLALNYGSRQEIVEAVKEFTQDVLSGKTTLQGISPDIFSRYLYTEGIPDPDLLIRTSGEMRLSNFLLWQLSYSEFIFVDKYWPDFREEDFMAALEEYRLRDRRFGGL
ncbi:MAG: isoprenyl transferase [Candidatus Omnitrophota bacterium]